MNKIVLNVSVLLALLNKELGYQKVEEVLPFAILAAVNFSEVVTVLIDLRIKVQHMQSALYELLPDIIPFDDKQALITGALKKTTKKYGLSLGDRACLALAQMKNLPVITADKIWQQLKLGVHIELNR